MNGAANAGDAPRLRAQRSAWRAGVGACLAVAALLGWSAEFARAAGGDAKAGARIFEKDCSVCHATQAEYHKEGPSLAGVYGRRAGSAPYFAHYKGLKGATFVWNEKTLDAWLADPRALIDGKDTAMTGRVADPAQRADLVAYLKTL